MKTSREIRKWIYTKPWAWRFVWNVCRENWRKWELIKTILLGDAGCDTIAGAFLWRESKENIRFWGSIDKQFINWYCDENK